MFLRKLTLATCAALAAVLLAQDGRAQAPAAPQPQPRPQGGDVPLFGPQSPPPQQQRQAPQRPQRPAQAPQRQQPPQQQQPAQAPAAPESGQQAQQPQAPAQTPPAQQQAPAQTPLQEPTPQPIRNEPYELPPPGTMIVVVDLTALQANSNSGQALRFQMERARNQLQTEAQREETRLRTMRQEIERMQPSETRNRRIQEFERNAQNYDQQFAGRRRQLDQVFNDAVSLFQRAVGDIIGEIVNEKQYLIVMNREAVIGFNTSLDVTPEVMRRLNIRLPRVQVNLPQ